MPKVYTPRQSWEDDYRVSVPTMEIYEDERRPYFSGLLDKNGDRLMCRNTRDPVGFVIFPEKD